VTAESIPEGYEEIVEKNQEGDGDKRTGEGERALVKRGARVTSGADKLLGA